MKTKRRKRGEADPFPALPKGEGELKNEFNAQNDYSGDWKTNECSGQKPGYITANPYSYPLIKDYRKNLKEHQTKTELLLWQYLRNNKTGYKIRRQHIIGDFIVDFVCLSKKLAIELDGEIHQFEKKKDKMRTLQLQNHGYEVIRFTNNEVLSFPEQVASRIKICLDNRPDIIS